MTRNLDTASGATTSATAAGATTGAAIERDVDRLSLEQALRDFEIANARAIDLAQRLVDLTKETERLRSKLVDAELRVAGARAENDALRSSMTFRVVELSTKIRRRLGR